ncbi:MAG: TetR/AcrR family transcriptional regulator [Micrococcaceae bacterium]|nr:TetR/AcrR family transcriptional regulator [Micrococcaceae bacterium]MDN5824410.1 TetR/AcrR family transcriptional regulator [Micrococcaceae bacterium]
MKTGESPVQEDDASEAGRKWRGVSRPQRDAARRHRLLEAGVELFGTQGYAATTVQGLCRQAGVSSRSFYECFSGREEVLETIYLEATRGIERRVMALDIAAGDTAYEIIRRGVQAGVGPMLEDERLGLVLEIEAVGVSPELETRRRQMIAGIARAMDAMMLELIRRGLVPESPPGLIGLVAVGGMTEALVAHLNTPSAGRMPVPEFVDELARVITRMAGG